VQLFADTQLTLTQDCVVDLGGYTATVTGDYTLYGMDSSADDLEGSGKAVWAEETSVKTAEVCYAPNGKIYVAIAQGAEVTYHYLNMRINGAAIRPSVSGMYYTGLWECDAALQAKLNTYGVAVDTVNLPDKDFMATGTALWTVMDAETLVNGETKTGAIISNIMSADRGADMNDAYGKMPIFAAAYVTLDSGTTVTGGAVGYSLYAAMRQLENCLILDPATYGKHIYPAGKFYRQWKDIGMGSWEFDRLQIDPYCPWNYNVVEQAVQEGKMHYYFMSCEWHAYSGGSTEPEKWGDCCLIVFPDGQTMLIDSGVTQYGPILVENLRRMGVTKLDHLVITHPHSDHQNGIFSAKNQVAGGVLDTFPIGQVYHRGGYDSKNLESSQLVATVCAERNLPLQTLDIGDSFQIGEVSVRVLWPQEGTADKDITGVNAAATNDTSVVLRFDYKEHSSLFTGDLYVESEARVMAANDAALLDVDLLKIPHHGSTVTSNSEAFLAAVSPEIAVATGFEVMDSRSLSRFIAVGANVLNDRTYGYIHVATDGSTMTYETSREAPLD
jgi:beta-lactamase superfamily II metal-dependent hydrolase